MDEQRVPRTDLAEAGLATKERKAPSAGGLARPAGGPQDLPRVFISYRHADLDTAYRLYQLLRERGVAAWYDALIHHGEDWRDAIVEHLSAARVMVVLLSSAALQSEELKKELAVAAQEQVPFLVVRLENVRPQKAFAYELARVQWFDAFKNLEICLTEVADYLESLVSHPDRIPSELEESLEAQRTVRRRRRLHRGLLQNPPVQLVILLLFSVVQFLLYEGFTSATDRLIEGGVGPLQAYAYVSIAVSVGSPLILLTVLRGGVTAEELPVLVTAVVNTLILGLLVHHFLRTLIQRLPMRGRQDR